MLVSRNCSVEAAVDACEFTIARTRWPRDHDVIGLDAKAPRLHGSSSSWSTAGQQPGVNQRHGACLVPSRRRPPRTGHSVQHRHQTLLDAWTTNRPASDYKNFLAHVRLFDSSVGPRLDTQPSTDAAVSAIVLRRSRWIGSLDLEDAVSVQSLFEGQSVGHHPTGRRQIGPAPGGCCCCGASTLRSDDHRQDEPTNEVEKLARHHDRDGRQPAGDQLLHDVAEVCSRQWLRTQLLHHRVTTRWHHQVSTAAVLWFTSQHVRGVNKAAMLRCQRKRFSDS